MSRWWSPNYYIRTSIIGGAKDPNTPHPINPHIVASRMVNHQCIFAAFVQCSPKLRNQLGTNISQDTSMRRIGHTWRLLLMTQPHSWTPKTWTATVQNSPSGKQAKLAEIIRTAARTAIHGKPSLLQVAKIFGALFCTASPYRTRDAVKMNVFAAENADTINTALTIEGRTAECMSIRLMADTETFKPLTPALWKAMTKGDCPADSPGLEKIVKQRSDMISSQLLE